MVFRFESYQSEYKMSPVYLPDLPRCGGWLPRWLTEGHFKDFKACLRALLGNVVGYSASS